MPGFRLSHQQAEPRASAIAGAFCYEKFLRTTGKKRKVPQQLYKAIF
jgi:hypothetical protein